MKKKWLSLPALFLVYVFAVLGFFLYAGLTGTRMLGDDSEKYEPSGPDSRGTNRIRQSRYYHK
jgi:hypothetical protein